MFLSGDVHFSEVNCYNATSTGKSMNLFVFKLYLVDKNENFAVHFLISLSWSW